MTGTITIDGVIFYVEYDHQPIEKATNSEPGCQESCNITSLTTEDGIEVLEIWETVFNLGVKQGIKKAMSLTHNDFNYKPNPFEYIESKILEK